MGNFPLKSTWKSRGANGYTALRGGLMKKTALRSISAVFSLQLIIQVFINKTKCVCTNTCVTTTGVLAAFEDSQLRVMQTTYPTGDEVHTRTSMCTTYPSISVKIKLTIPSSLINEPLPKTCRLFIVCTAGNASVSLVLAPVTTQLPCYFLVSYVESRLLLIALVSSLKIWKL